MDKFFWQLFFVVVLDGNKQPALFPFRYKNGVCQNTAGGWRVKGKEFFNQNQNLEVFLAGF